MRREGSPVALLPGVKSGTAPRGQWDGRSPEEETQVTVWSGDSLSASTPQSRKRGLETLVHLCSQQDYSQQPKGRSNSRVRQVNEWTSKGWNVPIIECYSALTRKEILTYVTTWTDLEGLMLSGISQSRKDKNYTIPPIRGTEVV